MKTKKNWFEGICLMLAVCMILTSCSKDEKLSNRLSGGWEGDWGMSYVDRDGKSHDSHHTVIEFYPNEKFDTYGYGYQEDYYDEGPYTKLGFYFEWSINHKVIYITYPGYPEYNAVIRDYKMKKKHFTGYIGNTYFDLDKVWKYYKWYDYAGLYTAQAVGVLLWVAEDYYYYSSAYGPTRSIEALDNMGGHPIGDQLPIRIYNRFAEQ